jgi:DNA-binding MarR family transcriptional regulator
MKPRAPDTRPKKVVRTLEENAYLELLQAGRVAERWAMEAMRPTGLTPSQFNVLRILRGARPEALPCKTISERMVHHDPDVTRLLDRLERLGWIEKARDTRDRRVVKVGITPAGLEVIESASLVVRGCLRSALGHLGDQALTTLIDLLGRVRSGAPSNDLPVSQATRTTNRRRKT